VENRKERHQPHGSRNRHRHAKSRDRAQHHDRERNAGFHVGQPEPAMPARPATAMVPTKLAVRAITPSAEPRRQQANRHHGDDMIDAAQRMQEARDQARPSWPDGRMRRWDKGKRNGGNAKRGTMHGSLRWQDVSGMMFNE